MSMRSRIVSLAVATIVFWTAVASVQAQMADFSHIRAVANAQPFGVTPKATSWQLFDLSRLRIQNSYSLSYVSGSGGNGALGLLQSTAFYQLAPNLSIAVGLAVAHDPRALVNRDRQSLDARLLPSFRLDYQPAKNVFMSVSVERRESFWPNATSIFTPSHERGFFDY